MSDTWLINNFQKYLGNIFIFKEHYLNAWLRMTKRGAWGAKMCVRAVRVLLQERDRRGH